MLRVNRLSEDELLPRVRGFALRCTICGVVLPVDPARTTWCKCGNVCIDVDAGRTGIGDTTRVIWFAIRLDDRKLGAAASVLFSPYVPGDGIEAPETTLAECSVCSALVACGDPQYTACHCLNVTFDHGDMVVREPQKVKLARVLAPDESEANAGVMLIRLSNWVEEAAPTERAVREMLDMLSKEARFAILQRGPEHYIQTHRSGKKFEMEVRAGGADRQYARRGRVALRDVQSAFLDYLRDPDSTERALDSPHWERIEG